MRQKRSAAPVLALCALLCACAGLAAAQVEIPRITIAELKGMMDQGTGVVILDTQPKAVYDKGHIKGAISFPWKARIAALDTGGLPRNKPIVTYCDCGPGESDSANVATQLVDLGFSNVKVLADPSIRGWKQAGYPME
jgi:rhodanese-related sulfurtransferase